MALGCRIVSTTNGHGKGLVVEPRQFRIDDGCLTLRIRPSGNSCYIKTLGTGRIPRVDDFA